MAHKHRISVVSLLALSVAMPAFAQEGPQPPVDADEGRDVIVITDTDPAGKSEIRTKLRPRGFSLVLLDKDLKTTLRKPLPWDVREITHAIDKFPIRRQEIQQGGSTGAGG